MSQQPLPALPLDLNNVQGDILGGIPKKTETYLFFQINDAKQFKLRLPKFQPLVKTTAQVLKDRSDIHEHKKKHEGHQHKPELLPIVGVNISFSVFGLLKLGIPADDITALEDKPFADGQRKDSFGLGDTGNGTEENFVPDWEPAFRDNEIHGLILVAGDSHDTVNKKVEEIKDIFDESINIVFNISGDVRPDKEAGHEHFGFLDGISNPTIIGFDKNPPPIPNPVRAGILLAGRDGDSRATSRPPWVLDGSFLAFRYLFQLVPEFDEFLAKNPVVADGLTPAEGSALRGARLVGRWKSGAPIDITPLRDDPSLAKANNFRFDGERDSQTRCPFAAHVRKTNPRADLEDQGISIENRRIMRRGIQFGPEVTDEEKRDKKTQHERGLLFVSYQSSIVDGFQFIQKSWANRTDFPPFEKADEQPGFDPIIGQQGGAARVLSGTDPANVKQELTLPVDWVVPRGGEYFFSPSIKSLEIFAHIA